MEFCSKCGSYMKRERDGFVCPRCGYFVRSKARVQSFHRERTRSSGTIDVIASIPENLEKISQTCPTCGNTEAFHWFSAISGEHAGVRRERTVEHFRCSKCSQSWAKST
jgi:DNA-directed RNA polymerase subunit M/transcription elongation factor TFIIS